VDIIETFSYLFGQTVAQSLVSVSSILGQFKISGFIGKEAHHQKNLQFIYVNKRLILKSKLHRLANSMLGNSFILKTNAASHGIPISKETFAGHWLASCPPQKRDKYAVYLLNVECSYHLYDISFDPKKTLIEFCDWDKVLLCMEMAIRTFLENEYSVNFSEESSIYSQQEKNKGNNISSLLKEMEQLEKENALEQLKTQHAKPIEITMADNSETHGHSETVTKKMLNVSRAVFGMPAKRKDKNEEVCYEDDLYFQSRALTFEETDVKSEITVVLESGVNRSNKTALPVLTPTSELGKCESENPFSCSETHGLSLQSKTPLTSTLKNSAIHTGRRNLSYSISDLSDVPYIEFNCGKSSVHCRFTETDSDLCPVQRFRNCINQRTEPKYHSERTDLPPITKFRETFHCVSNIQIPMPLKKFEFNALRQYLGTSQLLKEAVKTREKCDKLDVGMNLKDGTAGGCDIFQRNVCRYKDANTVLSSKVSTNLTSLLEEIAKKHADMSKACNEIHSNGHNNHKLLIDHSVQDDCKRTSSINVAKCTTQCESTENTEAAICKFEENISNCIIGSPYQSLRTKDARNTCPLSTFREPLCNEFTVPHKKTFEAEECVQTFDLAGTSTFEAEEVEKYMSNTQHHYSSHKTKDKDAAGRAAAAVHNQLKIMHPKINVQNYDTDIYNENNSLRNYLTSSDFLCTFERDRVKEVKFTTQNIIPVCQTRDFQNEHCATAKAFSCCEKSHNIQTYKKTVRFNPSDKRIFNSNAEGSAVQLFSSQGNSDCMLHSVNECVRPDLAAVTFRLSPEVDLMRQLGCRNVLTFLSNNSDMVCEGRLMTNHVQHSDDMKNHCLDNCTKGIPQVVLSSGYAMYRQQLGNNMIFSSGSEADVESCSDIELWSRKRRRVSMMSFKNISENKRFPNLKINSKYLCHQAQHINGNCSEESLKQKICYPLEKSESWKWNVLSKKQHDGREENYVGYLASDTQRSTTRLDNENPQMSVRDRDSQILDGSNDTILPSSCSSHNSPLPHLHQTDNCKMIISDSSSGHSLNMCNVTGSEVPGNLSDVQNKFASSSNGNETESEMGCSQLFCHEVAVETGDIFIPCGQMDCSEVRAGTVGDLESHVFKQTTNIISTSKISCISELPSKENNSKIVGCENDILETENIDSGKKSNILLELLSPKVTAVQGDAEDVTNETDKLVDTNKNNFASKSYRKEQYLFSKLSSSSNPVKCGLLSSYKCSKDDEASQHPFMKNVSSEQGRLFASEELSERNNEDCGTSRTCNCSDGESTREEVPAGGIKCSDQEYSIVKESFSSDTELHHTSDTFSLFKKNYIPVLRKNVVADSGSISNELGLTLTNGRSPTRSNVSNRVSCDDKFDKVTSAQTLKQDRILNLESISKQHYGTFPFLELKQYNNIGTNESSNNVNIPDRVLENNILLTDAITSRQMSHMNATKNEVECKALPRNLQVEKGQNLNELLHPVLCAETVGQHLRQNQSHLFDRKRRSEIECQNVYRQRNCMEKLSGKVSIPKCDPCENNAIVSEVCMSNSISSQDLNEAFDKIMSKVAEYDKDKQEDSVSIGGQDCIALHTLGDTTTEMDVCKETDERSHNSEDIDIRYPKGWKGKLDPKGKKFFVHVESGLTSYTVPSMLMAQNLYSMSKRFSFLPKGMSPILKNGVNKSCKESEENPLTPALHQALRNVVTDSYSLVDELATVKWKDMQETKGTGNVTHILIYVDSFLVVLYAK
jgi:hypothetical protein